jgi:competence protein ComEC
MPDACAQVLSPFLRERRLPDPTAAFVSHANADHYNAMAGLIADGRLTTVHLNSYFDQAPDPTGESAPAEFIACCLRRGAKVVRLRAGEAVELDERIHVRVLWPPDGRKDLADPKNANDTSLVLMLTCDGRRVLLPGDISRLAQGELLKDPNALRADVLILPHHGGWNPNLPALLRAVSPKVVVASAERQPRPPVSAGQAAKDFYARLNNLRYYTTPRNGWVRVRLNGRLEVETMK